MKRNAHQNKITACINMDKVLLNSEKSKLHAFKLLSECEISEGKYFVIGNNKRNRTSAQNALLWMIYEDMEKTDINEFAGSKKEEWHREMKKKFLVHIYERDDPEGYGSMINSIRDLYRTGLKDKSMELMDHIIDLTSTTKANVNQFSEFLLCVMDWCNHRGIAYRLPEDLHRDALAND